MPAASKACQQPINAPPQKKVNIDRGESSKSPERHIGGSEGLSTTRERSSLSALKLLVCAPQAPSL